MKKLTTIILITILSLVAIPCQSASMTSKQKQEVISKLNKATTGIRSMNCSFVQTKHLALLKDKMTSEGRMYYKQADKLRWEYTKPYRYVFIFNGTKVYVGGKDRRDVIDTRNNKIFKEVARIMMSTVTGTALSNASDFVTDVADGGANWNVTLVPKKKDMKQMFKKIELRFGKTNSMITEVVLFESNGDRTNIQLRDIKNNINIDEALFNIPK